MVFPGRIQVAPTGVVRQNQTGQLTREGRHLPLHNVVRRKTRGEREDEDGIQVEHAELGRPGEEGLREARVLVGTTVHTDHQDRLDLAAHRLRKPAPKP